MSVRPIILAEDNDKLRRLYADMLEAAGFNVMRACDGEKAIGLLHKIVNPQLIILDVMMPRLDGIETCIRVRKMQGLRPCPILFLTALDNPDTVLECLRAGGDDYMVKTAPMTEFLDRVRYWVRKGCSDDGVERREKAIRELEKISGGAKTQKTSGETGDEQTVIDELVRRINAERQTFEDHDKDQDTYRFGYLVGLVALRFRTIERDDPRFDHILRTLVYRTDLIDRKEIESLLYNYERIVVQSQFKAGWKRGRVDAESIPAAPVPEATASVEVARPDKQPARG